MNKARWILGTFLLSSVMAFGFFGIVTASGFSSEDSREGNEYSGYQKIGSQITFKQDNLYNEECGACHLAYPPNLLPVQGWQNLMGGLEDHFGENAELDKETFAHISNYLEQNGLQRGKPSKMSKMLRNIPDVAPARITELPYFIRKHDEIPNRMVIRNPKVGSFSRCDSCHKGAAKGSFNEDMVSIPSFGRWSD
ncbi:MAG: diacylglycerol kinase [Gammaproteobacteria bacterium]|nr:MAG: diacylglycerol kinase [Gammaproteobacteria bacterium]RLA19875.1 MAG: diacylglycerol kinase [Gammaproteobacteria bacterium]